MEDSQKVQDIARICHEANRAYCVTLGDATQLPWDQAPQWQRQSAVSGVVYALTHPEATPRSQHESWLADKQAAGWIAGPVKDEGLKTHPCCVPYDDLPVAQRRKDSLFLAIVRAY